MTLFKGPLRNRLAIRNNLSLSSRLRIGFCFFDAEKRETTAGTADLWAKIFAEVNLELEYRGNDFRT